ncbi:hypothetical protein ACP70R_011849 [Stipagrostis hirtigluma subsp. patula]
MPAPFVEHDAWYRSVLSSLAAATGEGAPEHLYTYTHVMHGFSAALTARLLEVLQGTAGHVAAFPATFARLHTTRTPEFLGLSGGGAAAGGGVWPASRYGDDVIIGIMDTGVWPESESFGDAGIQKPVPARWKGACEAGAAFKPSMCNRKLVGARSSSKGMKQSGGTMSSDDYDSPRDYYGHGSHTASTAAGAAVGGSSYFGYANGTATGIAPMASVAMYKAVFSNGTMESASADVLAAMDQAIADGVDVMSLSLGFPETSYDTNVIAIGAFAAMQKGIFVTCSAGNDGSDGYTITNGAPWITTVGASSIDRDFTATVTLGSGGGARSIHGKSVYPASTAIYSANLYYGHGNKTKQKCTYSSLSRKDVAGKFVFCTGGESIGEKMDEVQSDGGRGVIIATDLKDLLQVDILAAWVPNKEVMEIGNQKLFTKYMLLSGTSMASPHVAGVVALLRSVHPDWSPAAIRSAMMTTAYVKDNANDVIVSMPSGSPGTPLDFGSGHVSPNQAMDPGLVYDVAADDYVSFLCGLHYSSRQITAITGRRNPSCAGANLDLNYPSFMVILNRTNSATRTFRRVLTNVAGSLAKYSVSVTAPPGMKVTVTPQTLSFGGKGSKQAFTVTVQVSQVKKGSDDYNYIGNYGFLSWKEVGGSHVVTSPIVSAFAQ